MLRVIFVLSALFAFLFAQEEVSVFKKANPLQKTSPNQQKVIANTTKTTPKPAQKNIVINADDIKRLAGSDEPDVKGDELYQNDEPIQITLSSSNGANDAYVYEPFYIDVNVKLKNFLSYRTSVSVEANNIKLLNPKVKFNDISKEEASARLWFVATHSDANIAEIAVVIKRGGEFIAREGVMPKTPQIKMLAQNEEFSRVVADDLSVKSFKSSKFDEFNNLINLELEAKNGNLSEFSIPFSGSRGGVENIKGGVDKMSANYFLIAPSDVKNISFSYFSTKTNGFEFIDVPVRPASSDLSTQTSLNPQTSEFSAYKSIAVYVAIIICLLTFMLWRSFYGLVIAIILGIYALYDARPFAGVDIKSGSAVTILPATGSSVFYILSSDEEAKVLGKYDKYTKILLNNGKIGWVRNENIK